MPPRIGKEEEEEERQQVGSGSDINKAGEPYGDRKKRIAKEEIELMLTQGSRCPDATAHSLLSLGSVDDEDVLSCKLPTLKSRGDEGDDGTKRRHGQTDSINQQSDERDGRACVM